MSPQSLSPGDMLDCQTASAKAFNVPLGGDNAKALHIVFRNGYCPRHCVVCTDTPCNFEHGLAAMARPGAKWKIQGNRPSETVAGEWTAETVARHDSWRRLRGHCDERRADLCSDAGRTSECGRQPESGQRTVALVQASWECRKQRQRPRAAQHADGRWKPRVRAVREWRPCLLERGKRSGGLATQHFAGFPRIEYSVAPQ